MRAGTDSAHNKNATPEQPALATTFRYAIIQCAAVKLASQLRAEKAIVAKDRLPDTTLNVTTVNRLPVAMAFIISTTEYARAQKDYQYLGQAAPVHQCRNLGEHELECRVDGGNQTFKRLIQGDINRDGVEELVLQVTNAVEGGSYTATKLYVLSRSKTDAEFAVLMEY